MTFLFSFVTTNRTHSIARLCKKYFSFAASYLIYNYLQLETLLKIYVILKLYLQDWSNLQDFEVSFRRRNSLEKSFQEVRKSKNVLSRYSRQTLCSLIRQKSGRTVLKICSDSKSP
jgi:hypothetical protein